MQYGLIQTVHLVWIRRIIPIPRTALFWQDYVLVPSHWYDSEEDSVPAPVFLPTGRYDLPHKTAAVHVPFRPNTLTVQSLHTSLLMFSPWEAGVLKPPALPHPHPQSTPQLLLWIGCRFPLHVLKAILSTAIQNLDFQVPLPHRHGSSQCLYVTGHR